MQVERWPRSVSFITERFKFFHAVGECYPAPSSVPLFARHLLPYRRRLLLSCSLIALDRSCPLSQSATPDSRTQPCPAARPKGKNEKLPGGACSYPGNLSFSLPRGAGGQGHFQFYSSCFHVTNRFFVSFLVRPALLPYGKRGFRAAICNIARPQPPAAALWLQERIVPSCVPFLPPFPSSFTPC